MADESQPTRTPGIVWALTAALCVWITLVVTLAQFRMSPTYDEQNHVARGIAVLRTGDFRLCLHHPPLANVLEALPVAWRDNGFATTGSYWHTLSIWDAAPETVWRRTPAGAYSPALAPAGLQTIRLARLPVLVFTLALAAIIFLWSRELFGPWGGVLSLALFALDPTVLAHSGLATTDMAAACTIALAVFLLRRYLLAPTRRRLAWAGIGIGLALATKFSALLLLPIVGLLLLVLALWPSGLAAPPAAGWRALAPLPRLGQAVRLGALLCVVALLTVWGVYGFRMEPLGSSPGKPMPAQASLVKRIPVPTLQYLRGVKTVKMQADAHLGYLLGRTDTSGKGWWYYFPVAIATKTPLPELLLIVGILVLAMVPRTRAWLALPRHEWLFLLIPPGIYMLAAMGFLGISLNLGIRHVLPIYPFLLILAGGWVRLPWRPAVRAAVLGVCLLAQGASVLAAYPHFVAYFNEAAGGTENGYRILTDSNFDWGQDLGALAALQRREQLYPLALCYFGTTPPEAYGLQYTPLPGWGLANQLPAADLTRYHGYLAISATNLTGGAPYGGRVAAMDYRPLLRQQPVARVGQTIFVYRLP